MAVKIIAKDKYSPAVAELAEDAFRYHWSLTPPPESVLDARRRCEIAILASLDHPNIVKLYRVRCLRAPPPALT